MSDERLRSEMQRILDSEDRTKLVRALARLLREEEKRREALDVLRRMGR